MANNDTIVIYGVIVNGHIFGGRYFLSKEDALSFIRPYTLTIRSSESVVSIARFYKREEEVIDV